MPNASLIAFAIGARQFVVQLAFEMIVCLAGSYLSSLTPSTTVKSSPLAGAEIAPGQLARVALLEHLEGLATDGDVVGRGLHLVAEAAQDAVVLQQVGQR